MDLVPRLENQLRKAKEKQLFANFMSPGTFFSESTRVEVPDRDLGGAAVRAKEISERHGAKPYGFRFEDGNGSPLSGVHYLTGEIFRRDDVPDTDENRITRSNMSDPDSSVIVDNCNSWRFRASFRPGDFVIDRKGEILRRGDEPALTAYRQAMRDALETRETEAA